MGVSCSWCRLGKVAGILCLGLGLLGQSDEAALREQYRRLAPRIAQAERALREGHFAEARTEAEACIAQVTDHFQARFLLARLAYEARDFGAALEHIRLSEGALEAWIARAKAREAELVLDEPVDGSLWSAATEPSGCSTYVQRVKERARRNAEGSPFEGGEEGGPGAIPGSYSLLHGNILLRLGRPSGAETFYRQTLQADPKNQAAWTNLIVALLRQGKATLALKVADEARMAEVPLDPGLLRSLAEEARRSP